MLRYAAVHPTFYVGELRSAAREAFDAPNRPIAERRPLVIYLHHDKSIACNIFARDVSVPVCSFDLHYLVCEINHMYFGLLIRFQE